MGFELVTQDITLAVRRLRREPGFSAIAILTMALGISASVTLFSVADGVLLPSAAVAGGRRCSSGSKSAELAPPVGLHGA